MLLGYLSMIIIEERRWGRGRTLKTLILTILSTFFTKELTKYGSKKATVFLPSQNYRLLFVRLQLWLQLLKYGEPFRYSMQFL